MHLRVSILTVKLLTIHSAALQHCSPMNMRHHRRLGEEITLLGGAAELGTCTRSRIGCCLIAAAGRCLCALSVLVCAGRRCLCYCTRVGGAAAAGCGGVITDGHCWGPGCVRLRVEYIVLFNMNTFGAHLHAKQHNIVYNAHFRLGDF